MLMHDDFFTLPDGNTKPFFQMGNLSKRFIIQHPYFPFGSLTNPFLHMNEEDFEDETPVYFQQFELSTDENSFDFNDFLLDIERNWHLRPDEALWYETGFWSIIYRAKCYMGMGVERLKETLNALENAKFALCLCNYESILLINSKMSEENKILLSIYASNDVLPFVEVVEPFRLAARNCKNVSSMKDRLLSEEKLRRFWFANRKININPIAFVMSKDDPRYKMLPVIGNEFTRTKDPEISKIQFLTGTTGGGFIESDYYGGRQFYPHAEVWNLGSISIVEFHFEMDIASDFRTNDIPKETAQLNLLALNPVS